MGLVMKSGTGELMLAQEQGVFMRESGRVRELEGGLGGELEGTLVLTNRRLIFACTNERQDDLRAPSAPGVMHIVYSDVEDLSSIPANDDNLFIELPSITSVAGHAGHVERPSLEVKWQEGGKERGRVFIERLSGRGRQRNLNDWAAVIERLKAGNQSLLQLPAVPGPDTLEGKIVRVLADMQRKGMFEIEEGVEERFGGKVDPDAVQAACEGLATSGLVEKMADRSGNLYFQKRSPLGEDAL